MSEQNLTRNQKIVFDALLDAKNPMTAYDILNLEHVRNEGLKAPLTIYRALEKLLKDGLAHRIESLNAFVACSHAPHSEAAGFMICEKCKKTIELPVKSVEPVLQKQAQAKGFHLHKVAIEMIGLCGSCARHS